GFNAGGTGFTAAQITTNLGAGTVTINGTPSAAGSATFTVNVTDTAGAVLTQGYSVLVNAAPSFAPAALPPSTANAAYNQTVTVSNGSRPLASLSVTGFSAGTTGFTATQITPDLASGTVAVVGTPSAAGTASFTVNVTDAVGATASKTY